MSVPSPLLPLIDLSHQLGLESRGYAILGEGNTSMRLDDATFAVKASGCSLGTLTADDLVACRFCDLIGMLDDDEIPNDDEILQALMASRVDPEGKRPSVEALFHAYLLSLPDVNFVGHTHAIAVNQILCSPHSRAFADSRLFPDEIVCCGIASVFVPYVDPGVKLAQEIRTHTEAFIKKHQRQPKLILLENHGLITLGSSAASVLAAMMMAEKAARIYIGAAALGQARPLSAEHIARIAGRPDEHYRQRALNL